MLKVFVDQGRCKAKHLLAATRNMSDNCGAIGHKRPRENSQGYIDELLPEEWERLFGTSSFCGCQGNDCENQLGALERYSSLGLCTKIDERKVCRPEAGIKEQDDWCKCTAEVCFLDDLVNYLSSVSSDDIKLDEPVRKPLEKVCKKSPKPAPPPGTSRFKGVCWNKRKKKWRARLSNKGTREFLGDWETEEKAAFAYDKRVRQIYGNYDERLNFPDLPNEKDRLQSGTLQVCGTAALVGPKASDSTDLGLSPSAYPADKSIYGFASPGHERWIC